MLSGKLKKAVLHHYFGVFIFGIGPSKGYLIPYESFFSGKIPLVERNSDFNKFFIENGDYSANFMALNKPGGVSK